MLVVAPDRRYRTAGRGESGHRESTMRGSQVSLKDWHSLKDFINQNLLFIFIHLAFRSRSGVNVCHFRTLSAKFP